MKNEILKRAMFAMPLTKDARNSGIMAGFDDQMPEAPEDNVEEMPQMARTPQNPEILMNTLRGDMRSVDARYQELAQMVGEEAAKETPPEVLAMLQGQMGMQQQQQQGGIGSLPQGQNMAPPPMGMPDQGGAAPPEGGMPPPGPEGASPFPQGGAEQAPPTPDGMPPMKAAFGALVTPATRAMQFMGDKAAQYGPAVNQYMGNLMMRAQPTVQRLTGGNPAMPLSVQGRETLVQGPAGTIAQGVGTQIAPYTTMGPLMSPTFTEGLKMGVQRVAQDYPRMTEALSRISPGLGLTAGALSAMPFMKSGNEGRTPEQEAAYQALVAQIPGNTPTPVDQASSAAAASSQKPTVAAPAVEKLNPYDVQDASKPYEISRDFDATDKTDTQRFIKEALKEKTRSERTKEGYNELAPLFQEILGDNKEDMKTNALLMLADAGFKLASSRQPTFAMAVGEAASGLPRGFMGLLAQAKDRDLKIKSSALSQAFTDVQEQDKYAQQLKMKVLDGDFRILLEQIKNGNSTLEDGGAGLRIAKTKQGGFAGVSIDPKDPTVQSAIQSRWTLRDTDNPFVENRGQAPATVETDKGERTKLTASLRAMDNSLRTLDELKGVYTGLYSPGTWVVDKVNNLIVPISAGLVRPDVDQAAAAQRVQTGMNGLIKNLAASGDSGRVAVQEQEWARKTAENIADPVAFFQNKELAAKGFVTLETGLRNARQQLLTQLGYENNDLSMRVPSTGTQNDPFVIPADKDGQRVMFNFLGSTIGKLQDPAAMVYLRMPNNTVQQFNPIQLRGLIGNQ